MKKIVINLVNRSQNPGKLYNLSVFLNGWLMEQMDGEYVDFLHQDDNFVYSQAVYEQDENWVWEINILDERKGQALSDFLESPECEAIVLKAYQSNTFDIVKKDVSILNERYFADIFYRSKSPSCIDLQFRTVTAFKQNKNYVLYPDSRLLVQSAIMKYQKVFEKSDDIDEDFLLELSDALQIQRYNLRTGTLKVHQYHIPGYFGTISYRLRGSLTVNNYLNMLFHFAEFSGVGIKTALGMGNLRLLNK